VSTSYCEKAGDGSRVVRNKVTPEGIWKKSLPLSETEHGQGEDAEHGPGERAEHLAQQSRLRWGLILLTD
jgi:hypothetical protein